MDFDIGNLVYIVFLVIVFILNLVSKAKKKQKREQEGNPSQRSETASPPVNRGKSFDELLEEFTGNDSKPVPVPVVERPKPIPKPTPIPQRTNNPYQQALEARSTKQSDKSHSLLTTEFKRFDEFEDEEVEQSDYTELLRDADSAKKAFVLTEIFQRKY